MKVLCIKQKYAQDDCGYGPNKYSFVFTEKHCYYAGLIETWEDGSSVESNDFEVDDECYRLCLDKVIQYIDDDNTDKDHDEWDEYSFTAGWTELSEERFAELKLIKESALIDFVEDYAGDPFGGDCVACFDVSAENGIIKDCLSYLVYDFDTSAHFDPSFEPYESSAKEKLRERIMNQ